MYGNIKYIDIETEKEIPNFAEAPKPIFDFFPKHCETPEMYFSLSMIRIQKSKVKANIIFW